MNDSNTNKNMNHFWMYVVLVITATISMWWYGETYFPELTFKNVWLAWVVGYVIALFTAISTENNKKLWTAGLSSLIIGVACCCLYALVVLSIKRLDMIDEWVKDLSTEECPVHIHTYGKNSIDGNYYFGYSTITRENISLEITDFPEIWVKVTDFPADAEISVEPLTGKVTSQTPPITGWCYDDTYPPSGERIIGVRFTP